VRKARRRRLFWIAGAVVALWLLLGHLAIDAAISRWCAAHYKGDARFSFAVVWPWLGVDLFGARFRSRGDGPGYDLACTRLSVALDLGGALRGSPVASMTVAGLSGEVREGADLDLFQEPARERGRPPPAPAPPVRFSGVAVTFRDANGRSHCAVEADALSVEQEGLGHYRVEALEGRLGPIPFERATARIVPRGAHVLVGDLKLAALDGLVEGLLDVDRSRAGAVNGEISWQGVELARAAREFRLPRRERIRGRIDGRIAFKGTSLAADALEGKGELRLANGTFESPISLAVVLLLKLPVERPSMFHSGEMVFSFERSLLYVERARGYGTSFDLAAQGLVGFDGKVDLEVTHGATTVAVRGTLEAPDATLLPLNYLTRPFDRLFRDRISPR
jgi:hypothetical protein